MANLVRIPRNRYLAVRCVCGAKQVIAIARMADHERVGYYTLAHVAMTLNCEACQDGTDKVHLSRDTWP